MCMNSSNKFQSVIDFWRQAPSSPSLVSIDGPRLHRPVKYRYFGFERQTPLNPSMV